MISIKYKITKSIINTIKNGNHLKDGFVDVYYIEQGIIIEFTEPMYVKIGKTIISDEPINGAHADIGNTVIIQDYPFEKEIKQDNINKTIEKGQKTYNYYSSTKL